MSNPTSNVENNVGRKIRKTIKGLVKDCDLIGAPIAFKINEDNDYNSLVGGIGTILYTIFALIYIIYCAIPFVKRQNISIIYANKLVKSNPIVDFRGQKFSIAFAVYYADSEKEEETPVLLDPDITDCFEFTFTVKEWIGEDIIIDYPIPLEFCDPADYPDDLQNEFDLNGFDEMLCTKFSPDFNLTLNGLYTDDYLKLFELNIALSEEGKEWLWNIEKLASKDPMEFGVYFLDDALDYESPDNPLPKLINSVVHRFNYKFQQVTKMYFSLMEFTDDGNVMIDNKRKSSVYCFDRFESSFVYFDDRRSSWEAYYADKVEEEEEDYERAEAETFARFEFYASQKVIQIEREYQKFPSFLADLTSLLEEVMVLMVICITIYERKVVEFKLIDKMLKYKGSKYYDVDYLLNLFNKNKVSAEVREILEKDKILSDNNHHDDISISDRIVTLNKTRADQMTQNQSQINPINQKPGATPKANLINQNQNLSVATKIPNQSPGISPVNKGSAQNLLVAQNSNGKALEVKKMKDLDKTEKGEKSEYLNLNKNDARSSSLTPLDDDNLSKFSNDIQLTPKHSNLMIELPGIMDGLSPKEQVALESNVDNKDKVKTNSSVLINNPKTYIINYSGLNTCQKLGAYWCFCFSHKEKMRLKIIKKAVKKINYYLDIFCYIRKMQEVDILKYIMLDEDEISLFKHLSRPPIKMGFGVDGAYDEFEEFQEAIGKVGKNEIDRAYDAFKNIENKDKLSFEDLKLLKLVIAEVEFLQH